MPLSPVSYRIFTPFIFNPAIAGSKDFASVDLLLSNYGKSNSQVAGINFRLAKPSPKYITSLSTPEFTNIGIGAYFFNDNTGLTHNLGGAVTGSYHLKLDKNALSFLSFGLSAKTIFNNYSGNPDLSSPAENNFLPNVDAGIYYYGTSLFAGLSGTNLLGNQEKPDTLDTYKIPVSRQIFFQVGYKLVLSRSFDLILEPSLIVNSDDSFSGKITDMFKPALKLYAGSFCMGTYFDDFNKISFFLQYQYSRLYVGTYFALPYNSPFYKQPIIAEFSIGINISAIKSGFSRGNHW